MKLIKSGKLPEQRLMEYDGTCPVCGCIIQVTPDELEGGNFGQPPEHDAIITGHAQIMCPTIKCGTNIRIFKPYITR